MRILIALLSFLASSTAFADKIQHQRCLLKVGDKTYIDGPCTRYSEENGSFRMTVKHGWLAQIDPLADNPDIAVGKLNDTQTQPKGNGHLGQLVRNGDCWEGDNVKICTWK